MYVFIIPSGAIQLETSNRWSCMFHIPFFTPIWNSFLIASGINRGSGRLFFRYFGGPGEGGDRKDGAQVKQI